MSWITDVFSSSAGAIVDSVGNAVNSLVTSDQERLALQNELVKIKLDADLKVKEVELQYDKEITTRHQTDMQSDSWLSKNIRPLTLIFILGMYSLLSIGSGFNFVVTESYVQLLGQWGMLIMSFYFGGRSAEKMISIYRNGKS